MDLKISELSNHKYIELTDDVYIYNIYDFKKAFFKQLDGSHSSIVVDLKNVKHFDSSLLGALLVGLKKMKKINGELSLLNVNEDMLTILNLTNLQGLFKIYESEEDIG